MRQDQSAGTSQASLSSSSEAQRSSNATVSPERANVTSGPEPGGPDGRCGATPFAARAAPNASLWIRSGAMPTSTSAARVAAMNPSGPQRNTAASPGSARAARSAAVSRPMASQSRPTRSLASGCVNRTCARADGRRCSHARTGAANACSADERAT